MTRAVGRPGLLEVMPTVALGVLKSGDADGNRGEPKRGQQAAELLLGQGPPVPPLDPGALRVGRELVHQVDRPDLVIIAEGRPDIPEQGDVNGAIVFVTRQGHGRSAGILRPSATCQVRDRNQRPPVVGGAVVQIRQLGSGSSSLAILSSAHRFALRRDLAELLAVPPAQALDLGPRRFALEGHDNRAVLQRVGRARMVAIALGAQVENRRGLCSPFTSTLRMT